MNLVESHDRQNLLILKQILWYLSPCLSSTNSFFVRASDRISSLLSTFLEAVTSSPSSKPDLADTLKPGSVLPVAGSNGLGVSSYAWNRVLEPRLAFRQEFVDPGPGTRLFAGPHLVFPTHCRSILQDL